MKNVQLDDIVPEPAPKTAPEPLTPSGGTEPGPARRRVLLAVAGLALVALGAYAAFARSSAPSEAPAELRADVPVLEGDAIRFSETFARRIGLRDELVGVRSLAPRVHVTGTVVHDPRRVAEVGARIEGRVARLLVVEGADVDEGDALVEIDSAELGRAQAEVRAARARELAAQANLAREERLAAAQVGTERDAEVARAESESATAQRIAAEQTVRALGGSPDGASGRLVLRSPIAGRVIHAEARRGQTVAPTDTLLVVADASVVWSELAIFEGELGAVRVGDAVRISPQTEREVVLEGRVEHVGEVIDLETRTARVRVAIDNARRTLRVGQAVIAEVDTTGDARSVIAVPREAVTSVDGRDTVFVVDGPRSVVPRSVVAGPRDATHVAILEGLRPGERAVVAGTFALKSELFR